MYIFQDVTLNHFLIKKSTTHSIKIQKVYMLSEPSNLQVSANMLSFFIPQTEPKLNIQSFHQCSSLIYIKLNPSNLLLWCKQITALVLSLGVLHHLSNGEKTIEEIKDDKEKKSINQNYQWWWIFNFMVSWNHEGRCLKLDEWWDRLWIMDFPRGVVTIKKERNLKNMLIIIEKGFGSLSRNTWETLNQHETTLLPLKI